MTEATYRVDEDRWTLVFVRALAHPPERVWRALTEPEELRAWAPFAPDRSLARTGAATLTMYENATTLGDGSAATVTRAEPPSLLEYRWDDDLLRWELAPDGAGTRLTLSHTVAGRDWLPKVAAGWHLCLDVAERHMDGAPTTPIRGADATQHGWQALHDRYAERLGVSA
jgi:uncharacterized protein YndB with AHSA1/START domain